MKFDNENNFKNNDRKMIDVMCQIFKFYQFLQTINTLFFKWYYIDVVVTCDSKGKFKNFYAQSDSRIQSDGGLRWIIVKKQKSYFHRFVLNAFLSNCKIHFVMWSKLKIDFQHFFAFWQTKL